MRGTFLIKTISPSDIHSQVAAHFEVQLQFTMLCDLPVGMQVVIGMEDLKQSNIIDVHVSEISCMFSYGKWGFHRKHPFTPESRCF